MTDNFDDLFADNFAAPRTTANPQERGPSTIETAEAIFTRETIIGDGANRLRNFAAEAVATDDPGFSPYGYVVDNEAEFADVESYIKRDGLEDVNSEAQLRARVRGWRRERKNRETLQRGTAAGMILGTGLSFLDISTLIPVIGVAGKGGAALKIGKAAAYGGGITAAQEGLLQLGQDDRTTAESFMNIGIGTALGGGLGAFGHLVTPSTAARMDVRNPEGSTEVPAGSGNGLADAIRIKPLTPEQFRGEQNIPFSQVSVGARLKDAEARPAVGGAVGAAAQDAPARLDTPTTPLGRGLRKFEETLGRVNPNLRALYRKNPVARKLLIPLSNTPVHTTDAARAKGLRDVDGIKDGYLYHLNELGPQFQRELRSLREELGQSRSAFRQYVGNQGDRIRDAVANAQDRAPRASFNALSDVRFSDAVKNKLLAYDEIDPEFRQRLVEDFGEDAADRIEAAAARQADRTHRANLISEDFQVKAGVLKEENRMGRNYGMAVLYDRKFVAQYPTRVKQVLREKLSQKPDEGFLNAYGLDSARYDALGQREVTLADEAAEGGTTTISVEDGAAIKDEILADWNGSSKNAELEALEAELEAAQAQEIRLKADALDAFHSSRSETSGARKADLNLAKARARQGQRDIERYQRFLEQARNEKRQLVQGAQAARRNTQAGQFDALTQTPQRLNRQNVKASGRIEELDFQIGRATQQLEKLETRQARGAKVLAEAEAAAASAKAKAKAARDLRKQLKKDANKAGTQAKKTQRRLKKAEAAPDLNQVVEDVFNNIKGRPGEEMLALHEDIVPGSGRLKSRRIQWTPEERLALEKMGAIRGDMWNVLNRQYEEIGGELALREVYGDRSQGLSLTALKDDIKTDLDNSYDDLIEQARASGDAKAETQWITERDSAVKDLDKYFQYHLGQLGRPKDPESWGYWLSQEARKYNYTRYGLGFGSSSFPDIASLMLNIGRAAFSPALVKRAYRAMQGLESHEASIISAGFESQLVNRRSASYSQYNLDQAQQTAGSGQYGTVKNRVTSSVSRGSNFVAEQTTVLSGMMAWNTMGKTVGGLAQSRRIYDLVQDYEGVYARAGFKETDGVWSHVDGEAAKDIGQLSTIGIGAQEAKEIADRLNKFGVTPDADGVVSFNLHRWFDEGNAKDREVAQKILSALSTAERRAVPTAGAGDRPFLMSDPLASVLLQFQTYGFVSMSQLLTPMSQRLTHFGDKDAYATAMLALSAGLFVTLLKDGNVDRSPRQLAYDAFDRGGYLGYLSPYISATGSLLGAEGGSRYHSVSTVGQLLGPSFGAATDITTAAAAASQGAAGNVPVSDVLEKGRRVLPWQTVFRLNDTVLPETE